MNICFPNSPFIPSRKQPEPLKDTQRCGAAGNTTSALDSRLDAHGEAKSSVPSEFLARFLGKHASLVFHVPGPCSVGKDHETCCYKSSTKPLAFVDYHHGLSHGQAARYNPRVGSQLGSAPAVSTCRLAFGPLSSWSRGFSSGRWPTASGANPGRWPSEEAQGSKTMILKMVDEQADSWRKKKFI